MGRAVLFIFFISLAISGCYKGIRCPKTVMCNYGFNFVLVGYDSTDVDTVIIKVFTPDNTFSNLVDSAVIIDTVSAYVATSFPYRAWNPIGNPNGMHYSDSLLNDTRLLLNRFGSDTIPVITYDWEVILPRSKRTFKITGIRYGGPDSATVNGCDAKGEPVDIGCGKYLASYTVDGKVYNFKTYDYLGFDNFIFLNK